MIPFGTGVCLMNIWICFLRYIFLIYLIETQIWNSFITSKLSSPNSGPLGCSRPREGLCFPSLHFDLHFCSCWRQNMCYHREFSFWWTGIFHLSGVFWQAPHDMRFSHTWTLHAIHWRLWLLHKECNMKWS